MNSLHLKPLEIPSAWSLSIDYLDWYDLCENYQESFDENDGLFFTVEKAPKSAQAPKSAYLDYWKYQSAHKAPKPKIILKPKNHFSWRSDELRRLGAFLDEDEVKALFTDIRIAWLKAPKLQALKSASIQSAHKAPKNFMHTYKVWSAHIKRLKTLITDNRSAKISSERFIPSNLYQAPKRLINDSRALQSYAKSFVELFRQFRISNFNTGLGSAFKPSRGANISLEDNIKVALKRYEKLVAFRSAQETVSYLLGEKPEKLSFEDLAKKYRKIIAPKRPQGKDYQIFYYDSWVNEAPKFCQAPIVEALKTISLPKATLPEMKFWDSETQTFVDRRDILPISSKDMITIKTWVKTYMIYCGNAQYQQIDVFQYTGKTCLRTYVKQSAIKADSLLWNERNMSAYSPDQAPLFYGLCNYWFGRIEDKAPKSKAPKSAHKAPKREKPKNVSKKPLSRYSKSKMK